MCSISEEWTLWLGFFLLLGGSLEMWSDIFLADFMYLLCKASTVQTGSSKMTGEINRWHFKNITFEGFIHSNTDFLQKNVVRIINYFNTNVIPLNFKCTATKLYFLDPPSLSDILFCPFLFLQVSTLKRYYSEASSSSS